MKILANARLGRPRTGRGKEEIVTAAEKDFFEDTRAALLQAEPEAKLRMLPWKPGALWRPILRSPII